MATDTETLVEIEHLRESRELRLLFADGHESRYPLFYLRGHCPCAECQGHFQAHQFRAQPAVGLETIEAGGNYAVALIWADGHRFLT